MYGGEVYMGREMNTLKAIGPGFLFAAAAVGVSHLVQSTRAGAMFGLSLLPIAVLALILKYPFFEFGQRYAAATGTSLLEGYRRQGRWTLALYLVLTLGTMFTVLAGVTYVTAGLAIRLSGLDWPALWWSVLLIVVAWVVCLFCGFGLTARATVTSVIALGVGAAAVASAVLLILDLSSPYKGVIRASPAPLEQALAVMGKE